MKCPLDDQPAVETFCMYHEDALQNLIHNYPKWSLAYDGLSWQEYFTKLKQENTNTGKWVLELIQYLETHPDQAQKHGIILET